MKFVAQMEMDEFPTKILFYLKKLLIKVSKKKTKCICSNFKDCNILLLLTQLYQFSVKSEVSQIL